MREKLRIRGDALYVVQGQEYKLIVPTAVRKKLITDIHHSAGHGGISKVVYIARGHYYWPGMEDDIRTQIRKCLECQLTKGKLPRDKAPFQPTLVNQPFERIAIDISGPFHRSRHGYRYILAIIDYFSKFPVLIPLRQVDAETVARKVFKHWISLFGAPEIIHSDRGANFEAELFKEQCSLFGIKKTRTSPYYPQSDGLVERLFRTIKPLVSATVHSRQIPWCEALPFVEMGLRCSMQATTGYSPFEVMFGKRMRLPLSWQDPATPKCYNNRKSSSRYIENLKSTLQDIRNMVSSNMITAIERQREQYNYGKTCTSIHVGDQVLVKKEGHLPGVFPRDKFEGPYYVIKKNNHWSYQLQKVKNGKIIDRNYNQLKPLEMQVECAPDPISNPSDKETSICTVPKRSSTPSARTIQATIEQPENYQVERSSANRRYPLRRRELPNRFGATFI
jgi:transposase InsO family protein